MEQNLFGVNYPGSLEYDVLWLQSVDTLVMISEDRTHSSANERTIVHTGSMHT